MTPVFQKYIERRWRMDVLIVDEMWDMGSPDARATFEVTLEGEE